MAYIYQLSLSLFASVGSDEFPVYAEHPNPLSPSPLSSQDILPRNNVQRKEFPHPTLALVATIGYNCDETPNYAALSKESWATLHSASQSEDLPPLHIKRDAVELKRRFSDSMPKIGFFSAAH
eukprot:comp11215_c0_seq1/m.5674 comp11215_c0_seq1/g.5674  ORF comp11215_c0_seq1/g.5674 comp11215_c0_seq1/m.5674 type:complete len:123 (-) comp11215_c0_seq1:564-932(-)